MIVAVIPVTSWQWPEVFRWLQEAGSVDTREMYRTFNCGIGMVVVVAAASAAAVAAQLGAAGETVYTIGTIAPRRSGDAVVVA